MRAIILAGCLVVFLSTLAAAAPLRVVTEDWPPYNYTEDGKVVGLATEMVRAILDRAGVEYTLECLPWARAYGLALNDPGVMIYSILKVGDREPLFKWVRMDGLGVDMYLFRPQYRREITASSIDEAKAYRVGVTRESATHHFLLSKGFTENVNLFPVRSEFLNILKSEPQNGRIDLTTGDLSSVRHWLRMANKPDDYWEPLVPLFHRDLYMAFSLRTPDAVVERVRRACRKLGDEGGLKAIQDKFHCLPR